MSLCASTYEAEFECKIVTLFSLFGGDKFINIVYQALSRYQKMGQDHQQTKQTHSWFHEAFILEEGKGRNKQMNKKINSQGQAPWRK